MTKLTAADVINIIDALDKSEFEKLADYIDTTRKLPGAQTRGTDDNDEKNPPPP